MMYALRILKKWLPLAVLALAAACTTAPRQQQAGTNPHYKVGKPYEVNGKWYYPKEEPDYSKVGVASWYGSQFHGRLTANGEIFDMNRISAAHTTLPLPSMVEVTNLENGKSVVVRVNDRGPFARDRIIDMSREAARQLGFEQQGTARVRVRYAGPAPLKPGAPAPQSDQQRIVRAAPAPETGAATPATDAISELLTGMETAPALTRGAEEFAIAEAESGGDAEVPAADLSTAAPQDARLASSGGDAVTTLYVIRVASLSRLDNIDALRAQLGDIGPLRVSRVESADGKVFYRINLGPFASIETAAEKLAAVRAAGYADAALVTLAP